MSPEAMSVEVRRPDRALVVIISIIAVVVIIGLVVVFTRGTPTQLDPATPEGVVQSYASAAIDGDVAAAKALLAKNLRENCDSAGGGFVTDDLRVTLVTTKISGDSARVRVSVSQGSGGGIFGNSYESDASFSLVVEDGVWRVDSAPWELVLCYNQGASE